jgi:hypothetical protein
MYYIAIVASEFVVTIIGVACIVRYYNHKD